MAGSISPSPGMSFVIASAKVIQEEVVSEELFKQAQYYNDPKNRISLGSNEGLVRISAEYILKGVELQYYSVLKPISDGRNVTNATSLIAGAKPSSGVSDSDRSQPSTGPAPRGTSDIGLVPLLQDNDRSREQGCLVCLRRIYEFASPRIAQAANWTYQYVQRNPNRILQAGWIGVGFGAFGGTGFIMGAWIAYLDYRFEQRELRRT